MHIEGVKTLNVVRWSELVEELREMSADIVLVDSDDLVERVRDEVGNANISLAIDAIAGKGTLILEEL